jgi:hypothetical protein
MRNALALYEYHLPNSERQSFLALLFPRVPAAKRARYLTEIVTPVPPFYDERVEQALAELRPRTAGSAYAILNAADVAVRLPFDERDRFVRSVCGFAPTAQSTSRTTLFDAHRATLRHLSNEDRRVVRALGSLSANPYACVIRYTHRRLWRASSDYVAELGRWQTEEDAALIAAMEAGEMPRVFRDDDSEQLHLHYLLCTGHEVNEAFAIMERNGVGTRSSRKRDASAPAADAAMAVGRTRHENDVRVLHDQRGALQAQLTAKTTIIETLEQERASDRKRIAELEAAQNRTLQAFKELQHAENRRLDAYMGVRRAEH